MIHHFIIIYTLRPNTLHNGMIIYTWTTFEWTKTLHPVINRKPRVSFWLAYRNGTDTRNTIFSNRSRLIEVLYCWNTRIIGSLLILSYYWLFKHWLNVKQTNTLLSCASVITRTTRANFNDNQLNSYAINA